MQPEQHLDETQDQRTHPGLLMAVWLTLLSGLKALKQSWSMQLRPQDATRNFLADARGFINMGSITGIVATVVIGIVILLIIAALAPTYITAIADLVNALESGTTNNTTADTLLPVFGLLVALGGVFAIVGFAFLAYKRRRN